MIKKILIRLIHFDKVSFDQSLINTILIIGILIGFTSIFVNFLANVNFAVHLMNLFALGTYGVFYYRTRIKGLYNQTVLPIVIMSLLMIDGLWITAGGLASPMVFYTYLSSTCFIIFTNSRTGLIVAIISILNLIALIVMEAYTDWVIPYPDSQVKFIDMGMSSVITLLLMILLIRWLKINYQMEQDRANERSEKVEILLRELHHRVKNNLQIISSLWGLQMMRLDNEEAKYAANAGKERIRAMSLIHQKLYQTDQFTKINIKEYIDNLVLELTDSYGYKDKAHIQIDVPPDEFDIDTTLPLGLIINELTSNAFKYAFENVEKPILVLRLWKSSKSEYTLFIQDNGKGLPPHFSIAETSSFGLRLVNLLVKQIKGNLTQNYDNGLTYQISFQHESAKF
jgi:two-component sensor histidine kinase